jgi:hypothetical protein
MTMTTTLHHGESVRETAESCGDIARKRERVFVLRMTGSTGVDEIEGGEEGGQIGAAGRSLVLFLFLDIVFDCRWSAMCRE